MRPTRNESPSIRWQGGAKTILVVLTFCQLLRALNPDLLVTQYIHSGWTARDGFGINSVTAIAQTADGYLWLGTVGGLVRFDGMNFVKEQLEAGALSTSFRVTSLLASRNGGLWIGTENGIAYLDSRRRICQLDTKGIATGVVLSILEDRAGGVWAGTSRGLIVFRSGNVNNYGTRDGLPSPMVYSLADDAEDNIWIGTAAGACKWVRAESGCRSAGPNTPVFTILPSRSDGSLIIGGHVLQLIDIPGRRLSSVVAGGTKASMVKEFRTLLLDRNDNLWTGGFGAGLVRLRKNQVDQFTMRDGLTGDLVQALFEDRESNLWVGTNNGIDRFREPTITRVSTVEGLSGNLCTAVCSTRDGSIWVGVSGAGLDRVRGRSISHYSIRSALGVSTVFCLHQDVNGTLWAGTNAGLFYLSGPDFIRVDGPPGIKTNQVVAMTDGGNGVLWAADMQGGLLEIKDGVIRLPKGAHSRGRGNIYQLFTDTGGTLWVGYYQGGVSILGKDSSRYYPPGLGPANGAVEAIYQDSTGAVWVGTTEGLSRFRNQTWSTWTTANGLPVGDIEGIIESHGVLWVASGSGLIRLGWPRPDLNGEEAPQLLAVATYGPGDGIHLPARRNMINPRLTSTPDGRLLIGTEDGLAVFDPNHLRASPPPVSALIEGALADGRPFDLAQAKLRSWGRDIRIEFTAVSLTMPEAVRFRHKLEGRDGHWSTPDNVRQIVYSDLPPGKYRFLVMASNTEGVWSGSPAKLDFERLPYFYQTRLFYFSCIGVLGLAIYAVYVLRVRTFRSRFGLILQERSRMARELHDTLMQGFAGVVYFLAAASRRADSGLDIDKEQLRHAVEQADQSLKEAREAISCMRLSALEDKSLSEALAETGKQLVDGTSIRFHTKFKGLEHHLEYETQVNLYIIAREAISNAVMHARPSAISLEITYRSHSVDLLVRDDGDGFDLAAIPSNHWGVLGMQERAKHMGARLEILTKRGCGTTIQVLQRDTKAV